MNSRTSLERRWEPAPGWRSETPQSERLSEPLGHPPRPQPRGPRARAPERLERARGPAQAPGRLEQARGPARAPGRLGQALEQRLEQALERDRIPFILVGDNLNCRQTHCLECIKDVALDVEEHSREYEPWD